MKTAVLAGAVLLACGCVMTTKAEISRETVEKVREQQERHLWQVDIMSRKNIQSALNVCGKNGEIAAKYLNKIKGRRQEFEMGVREVLNEYYSMEETKQEELENFEECLDESVQTIVAHYEEAKEERENSENLDYQTEEVLVTFPYGTSQERIEEVVRECAIDYEIIDSGELEIDESLPEYKKKRLEKIKDYKTDVVVLAKLGLEDTVARAEEKFEKYSCVVNATKNSFLEADGVIETDYGRVITDDPQFNVDDQWNMETIDLPRAYRRFRQVKSATEIWVAVIDGGVQMNHPDLKGSMLTRYSVDVTQKNKKLIRCADKKSEKGQYTGTHGTMVAGIIAARVNNGKFCAGVASAASGSSLGGVCKIMAIKFDDSSSKGSKGRHLTKGSLAKAIDLAVSSGAEVINISYSAKKEDYGEEFKYVRDAIKRAIKANVCVVASAGNDGTSVDRYPASFKGVISVGATKRNNDIASYSNRSKKVDILAPVGDRDEKRISCLRPTTCGDKSGVGMGNGTSCAAPQVAATAAMMKSIDYNLTPAQILSRLKKNTTVRVKVEVKGKVREIPLLNAGKAVESVR